MRDKKKTLDKKYDNLKLKKITKKQKLKEHGITLIALVVTIIILLILAGVTLNIALSDNGLFSKTKEAAEKYKEAQSEEEDLISQFATQMYSEYVGAEVTGYSLEENKDKIVTIDGTTVGIDINTKDTNGNEIGGVESDGSQKFTTDTDIKWRVWDFDGNILRIIGDPTTQKLALKGVAGYNNGVWAINHICEELYSNDKNGVTATNLKRTDIQKVSTYDYTKNKHHPDVNDEVTSDGNGDLVYYGSSKVYTENFKYPKIWEENDKDWEYEYKNGEMTGEDKAGSKWEEIVYNDDNMNCEMITGNESVKFKQSNYYHVYKKSEFINEKYFDLIFMDSNNKMITDVWLASRSVSLFSDFCEFLLQEVQVWGENGTCIGGRGMAKSDRRTR